jgi:hypothetical protein
MNWEMTIREDSIRQDSEAIAAFYSERSILDPNGSMFRAVDSEALP